MDPIINAKFKKFIETYDLCNIDNDKAFEYYSNHAILYQHQPDAFSSDSELLNAICVGGSGDLGQDGISIKVNGFLIKDIADIEYIAKRGSLDIEFIFIQSKNKEKFTRDEFLKFTDGILAFFDDPLPKECNDSVKLWVELKNTLLSDNYLCLFNNTPSIRCYYTYLGTKELENYEENNVKRLEKTLKERGICSDFHFTLVDKDIFKSILNRNANKFTCDITTTDTMGIGKLDDVDDACIATIEASEFMKLLDTDEGIIRKSLFYDNVRDFQGFNSVNKEMLETINDNPNKFIILNNGITVVCSKFIPIQRRLSIENPQVVNGCQTCNVLYHAMKTKPEIVKGITLVVKVISTQNGDIVNEIVRGTNRQTQVPIEAFEGIKKYHKDLEEYISYYQSDFSDKIYYERRAKQYENNPSIKPTQVVSTKALIQYSVGALINKPHMSHLREIFLLEEFGEKIFNPKKSKLPLFAVMYAFYTLELLLRNGKIDAYYNKFKAHLLMLVFAKHGCYLDMQNSKDEDDYAESILSTLYKLETAQQVFNAAIEIFNKANQIWVHEYGKSNYAKKDIPEFTELLIHLVKNQSCEKLKQKIQKQSTRITGVITFVSYAKRSGIITYGQGQTIWFSFLKNTNIKLSPSPKDKHVSFEISSKDYKDRYQAIRMKMDTHCE